MFGFIGYKVRKIKKKNNENLKKKAENFDKTKAWVLKLLTTFENKIQILTSRGGKWKSYKTVNKFFSVDS